MTTGGMVTLIRVVLQFTLDDLLVVFLFFLFLLTVTRAGAIGHRGWLMGSVRGILLAGRRVSRGHERCMEGVRERLIILRIVHDFLGSLRDKSPEMDVTLRAESNRCRQQQPNPVGTQPRRICPCSRRAFHWLASSQKILKIYRTPCCTVPQRL